MKAIARGFSRIAVFALAAPLAAQTPPPQFKGVWEPVSFTEDIMLYDVFFANVDVGWASGAAGTIIHTADGGKTWKAQLGGDPQNKADKIWKLRFFDERHGWAAQGRKLLRTTDGEDWEEIGTLPYETTDLVFTSRTDGFVAGKPGEIGGAPTVIYRTRDGGKTWKPAWSCSAKVTVQGLVKQLGCTIMAFQFPTPQVGYAVLNQPCFGMGCGPPPLIAKTEDGGETWRAIVGPGVMEQDYVTSLFFTDEKTGFVRLTTGKLYATKDGGETWRGIVASPGKWIRFADPGVGWSYEPERRDFTLSYSTDGGARWNSRPLVFPAYVYGMSFPRRDRAYVVGEHGMVYRYRVVPASQPLRANDIAAPAMPGIDSPLDTQIDQLRQVVTELSAAVGPGGSGSGDLGARSTELAIDAPLPPASDFTTKCCAKSSGRLEALLGALSQSLPQFIDRYRNLNLLVAGIRMGTELPDQYRSVKGGLHAFRTADSKEAAQSALATVSQALGAFKTTTAVAFQKELPPPDTGGK